MADGTFPNLVSKDINLNAADNAIFVQLSDGTNVIGVTGGAIDVNVSNTVTVAATDLDIRDLSYSQDSIMMYANTAADGSGSSLIPVVDADGNLQVDVLTMPAITLDSEKVDDSAFTVAVDSVSVGGYLANDTNPDAVDEGDVGAARMTLDRKQLMVLADPNTDANRLAIDSNGNAAVNLAAVGVTAVPISKDSNANSETNPIYVHNVDTVVSGVEVHDFNTAVDVGSGSTSNHDYSVVNNTFLLKSIIASGSGNVKFEVQVGPIASLSTVAVGFLNGRQGDTKQIIFDPPIEVPVTGTGTVRVVRTNRQGIATDVYSTIIGSDI